MSGCLRICVYTYMRLCIRASMRPCVRVCVCVRVSMCTCARDASMRVCVCVCVLKCCSGLHHSCGSHQTRRRIPGSSLYTCRACIGRRGASWYLFCHLFARACCSLVQVPALVGPSHKKRHRHVLGREGTGARSDCIRERRLPARRSWSAASVTSRLVLFVSDASATTKYLPVSSHA